MPNESFAAKKMKFRIKIMNLFIDMYIVDLLI